MERSAAASLLRPFEAPSTDPRCNPDYRLNASSNDLVLRLSDVSRRLLLQRCERVPLAKRQVLYDRGIPLQYAYFIESGGSSVTTRAGDCLPVEINTLGRKDFVGVPLVLGTRVSPHRCTVQVAGQALRIPPEELISLMKESVELEKLLLGYVQAILIHGFQLVACNSRHTLLQRLARWLLVASERLGLQEIPFTHSYIANALAVRRPGVTVAVGELMREGAIRCRRGRIIIADGGRLKTVSCDCHSVILSAHERCLPPV